MSESIKPCVADIGQLGSYADLIRKKMLDMYSSFGYGCMSGAFSMVELYTALYLGHLDAEKIAFNDELRTRVIPKPSSMLAFYAALSAAGILEREKLDCYGTDLLRPMPHADFVGVDATNYTIGPNLGVAVGLALSSKMRDVPYDTICMVGDGELQAGVDQAAKISSRFCLDNLALLVDCNRLQSFYETAVADPTTVPDENGILRSQQDFWKSLGWHVAEIDGHDFGQILDAYSAIGKCGKPYVILARTVKGKGLPGIEGKLGYQHRIDECVLNSARDVLEKRLSSSAHVSLRDDAPAPKRIVHARIALPFGFSLDDFACEYSSESLRPVLTKWLQRAVHLNPGRFVLLDSDYPKLFGDNAVSDVWPADDSVHVFPGLNEKLMFSMAKGMAYENLYPVVSSPCVHASNSCEEWNGICMDKLPVLFIGTKPGAILADWGPTHCSFQDVVLFKKPGCSVYQPSNRQDLIWILNNLYKNPSRNLPAYLRVGDFNVVTDKNADSEDSWGRGYYVATGRGHVRDYVALIATGDLMQQAVEFHNLYSRLARIKVLNLFNLLKVDSDSLRQDLEGASSISSLIEASSGSIAEMIFKSLSPSQKAVYDSIGIETGRYIPDRRIVGNGNFYGARDYVLKQNGLDVHSLARRLLEVKHG